MNKQIVECIPNFSEARRPEVIESIANEIESVANVYILDKHMDTDHNRTVITFAGSPKGVEEAAFRAIKIASQLIDLNLHTGEHPRIGATDVFPFVPIAGVTMEDCIAIAQRVGKRVGEELDIPIYLYEEAATSPERKNLEYIRKGEYEQLKEEIGILPARNPDFGPARLGTAGATVIGARHPLIAFNVDLHTNDVEVAKKIAKTIRHSSGGLRYVKALGLTVNQRAQVSMNLTNYKKTPLALVVETIRREAARYGVNIFRSELVGLIPQDALNDTAIWYLQLDLFNNHQILESRLASVMRDQPVSMAETTTEDFLAQIASGDPTPGGGSAAALSAATAAALVAMVGRVTFTKKKYENVKEEFEIIISEADNLRNQLYESISLDSQAYNSLMHAYRLPKETSQETETREIAIQKATLHAARVPLETAQKACKILEMSVRSAEIGNINALSDAGSAGALAIAAIESCALNVRINLNTLKTLQDDRQMISELVKLEEKANILKKNLKSIIAERS